MPFFYTDSPHSIKEVVGFEPGSPLLICANLSLYGDNLMHYLLKFFFMFYMSIRLILWIPWCFSQNTLFSPSNHCMPVFKAHLNLLIHLKIGYLSLIIQLSGLFEVLEKINYSRLLLHKLYYRDLAKHCLIPV